MTALNTLGWLRGLLISVDGQGGQQCPWRVQLLDTYGAATSYPVVCMYSDHWVLLLDGKTCRHIQEQYIQRTWLPRRGVAGQKVRLDCCYGLADELGADHRSACAGPIASGGLLVGLDPCVLPDGAAPSFFVHNPVDASLIALEEGCVDEVQRIISFLLPDSLKAAIAEAWTPMAIARRQ